MGLLTEAYEQPEEDKECHYNREKDRAEECGVEVEAGLQTLHIHGCEKVPVGVKGQKGVR